ncbi:hypothetical protein HZ994_17270 [Akkermansiaceae bacterium]|nr:hypothetical protein HZ994_17270 [Akkermansiaceae bacterium]
MGSIELEIGGGAVELTRQEQWDFSGTALIDPSDPIVSLKALPNDPKRTGVPRMFAKLVVETEGKKTFTHVFDATGVIDDFVELPF